MKTVAIIPARLGSTRLTRKALADIHGRPMIAHVVERVRAARGLDGIWVATDSEEIAQAARAAGAQVAMTSPDCASGTDRVAQAAREIEAELILNLQGDEPMLPPAAVEALRSTLLRATERGIELATLARPLEPGEEGLPQVVKVVLAEDSSALYFSRSLVPYPRQPGLIPLLAHVGLYGYTRSALQRFAELPSTALERTEGLEQLRALGHGWRIAVGVGDWKTQAVDTAEDLAQVRARIASPFGA